jgi:hypothetical protein
MAKFLIHSMVWQVVLNVNTPMLGRLVIEGSLIVNDTSVNLTAVYIELRGGKLIIATTDEKGQVLITIAMFKSLKESLLWSYLDILTVCEYSL